MFFMCKSTVKEFIVCSQIFESIVYIRPSKLRFM